MLCKILRFAFVVYLAMMIQAAISGYIYRGVVRYEKRALASIDNPQVRQLAKWNFGLLKTCTLAGVRLKHLAMDQVRSVL